MPVLERAPEHARTPSRAHARTCVRKHACKHARLRAQVLFIAGGVGVTPVVSALHAMHGAITNMP